MKKLSLAVLFFTLLGIANAQVFNRLNAPVTKDDAQLANPWLGGLNAPQWSAVDLNNDGKQDLYAFDRNGDVHLTFLNVGGPGEAKYQFDPSFAANFPKCGFFTLLRDYNRDGAMDLFACSLDEGIAGMKLFKGSYNTANMLSFERVEFPWIFDVLLVEAAGAPTNLPINGTDYPAVDDIDGDGDLDILAFSITGSKVNFFQNMALEQGYTDDTLIFKLADDCWGDFYIPAFSESMLLSQDPNDCANFQSPDPVLEDRNGVHGGATLLTFDDDNDGDKELMFGDLIYPHLIYGKNCGSPSNAWLCSQDTVYPSYDYTVEIPDFPAAFYLDIDNDGAKDLMASPNLAKNVTDENVAWFFKNTADNLYPVFDFQTDYFIVGESIDHGTGAHPAFVDVDADGLLDFVVGNETVFDISQIKDSRLHYYKNVGTATDPAFELVDGDWLDFSQFIDPNLQPFAYAPAFGDVDGDGDADLVVGERHGRFFYGENIAGPGNPLAFAPIVPYWQGIAINQNTVPFIHDMNKDGLGDLLVGTARGTVTYLPNIGTVGNPEFHTNISEAPNNEYFGRISTQQPGWTTGYSAPAVIEAPNGDMFIVTGSELGFLEYYKVNPDSMDILGARFELIDEQLGGLREGRVTRPAFGNLNGDDVLDCLVGNHRGGLGLFSSPLKNDGSVDVKQVPVSSFSVEIYPNPAGDQLFVAVNAGKDLPCDYAIFNSIGQLAYKGRLPSGKKQVELGRLSQGIYFIELRIGAERVTKRFVKE